MKARHITCLTVVSALLTWSSHSQAADTKPAAAAAAPSGSAEALFKAQQFLEAAAAARNLKTADGYTLAARATLAQAAYFAPNKAQAEQLVGRALQDAEAALALSPGHADAGLQRAIATGYRAKLSRSPQLGREARQLMEESVKRMPDSGYARAALGGWHGEVVLDLGSMMAKTMLGASKSEALRHLEAAQANDPTNPGFPTFLAFFILRLEGEAGVPKARALLAKATQLEARGGVDALMQKHARAVAAALAEGKTDKAIMLAHANRAFGQISARK